MPKWLTSCDMSHILPAVLVSHRTMGTVGRAGSASGLGGNTIHATCFFLKHRSPFSILHYCKSTISSGRRSKVIRETGCGEEEKEGEEEEKGAQEMKQRKI